MRAKLTVTRKTVLVPAAPIDERTKNTVPKPKGKRRQEENFYGRQVGQPEKEDQDEQHDSGPGMTPRSRRLLHPMELTTMWHMQRDRRCSSLMVRLLQAMLEAGHYKGMKVERAFDLVEIETTRGRRVVLPPTLWSVVFKEMHGSISAGHLRGPHTYGRVAQLFWWPGLHREVNRWVRGCQESGSRKARPREVIPPLRSLRGGDVGDRWALDVAGPFPVAGGGERYIIAALEYVTRYTVARSVVQHTAERVATFLMEDVLLKYGVFRELLTDGAPEMTGRAIEQLVILLEAKQTNPAPYRPQMRGRVERFHRTWKDCVSTFMADERQNGWCDWVQCAVFAYNSAQHSTVAISLNELMMGRRMRSPNELLR
ncbi:hypothetical protein PC116_g12250 [Phytophthora cactorum]|nr:hypothetical protein Pcac1_g3627 [Phytophthora cactorum]KAG3193295.1 hypothetical protein C6341_g222 [Phytophthora cactorum]KAG4239753.1 hypothetical protein PC116_g12250 [Phytophthora cactorum]